MESRYGEAKSQYAPTNEMHGGVVSYNNQGIGANSRRQSAYKKMYSYCAGDYKILQETNTHEGGAAQTIAGYGGPVTFYNDQKVVKIAFQCAH